MDILKIDFHNTFCFPPDLLLLKHHCSFSLLAQRKRTKRKGLLGPHKRSFLPLAKPVSLSRKSLQGFRILCG
ncbi:MAG: hypothetical protein CFE24_14240 [Flavobacterium sp. BFFFF2]|nr:MAG: hypothetical protein CFE24_14240 [Flavobacterium sp. BFFFF2]